MKNVINRIFEIVDEEEKSYQDLAEYLNLSDVSIVYTWKRGESYPATENLIKLSELYNCSLDYLLNRTDDYGKSAKLQVAKFSERLEDIIKKSKIKKYKLEEEKICSSNNLFKWKRLKSVPSVATLLKLADYFNVSVDYLLGGE